MHILNCLPKEKYISCGLNTKFIAISLQIEKPVILGIGQHLQLLVTIIKIISKHTIFVMLAITPASHYSLVTSPYVLTQLYYFILNVTFLVISEYQEDDTFKKLNNIHLINYIISIYLPLPKKGI